MLRNEGIPFWGHVIKMVPAIAIILLMDWTCLTAMIHVFGKQPTIQGGIDAADYGHKALVTLVTYHEHPNFGLRRSL